MPPIEQLTAQGYDLQFGTNVLGKSTKMVLAVAPYPILRLGHFYFTKLLLPTLLATAKVSPDGKVRVVNTSSSAHMFYDGIDFNTFKDGPARTKKGTQIMYCQSKLVRFPSTNFHQYSCNY